MSNFSVVIPSDHESKIAIEERKAVNTRNGRCKGNVVTKEYHCRAANQCAEWGEDNEMFLFLNCASTVCQVPGYVGWC